MQTSEKRIIGRRDKADFPDLKLKNVDVKIDTGAYSAAIHCHNIRAVRVGGRSMVRFNLLDPSHPRYNEKSFRLPLFKKKRVKSSTGRSEFRYFIRTRIRIFGQLLRIEASLTDRSDMKYPVLLGRKVLMKRFVVNVARYNLSYREKSRTKKGKRSLK